MIVFAMAVAAAITFGLVASSFGVLTRATAVDASSRGRWGVLDVNRHRRRRLDEHETRWQTALITARQQPNRWPDLIREIEGLEKAAELASDPQPPEHHDPGWVDTRLATIERHLSELDAISPHRKPTP